MPPVEPSAAPTKAPADTAVHSVANVKSIIDFSNNHNVYVCAGRTVCSTSNVYAHSKLNARAKPFVPRSIGTQPRLATIEEEASEPYLTGKSPAEEDRPSERIRLDVPPYSDSLGVIDEDDCFPPIPDSAILMAYAEQSAQSYCSLHSAYCASERCRAAIKQRQIQKLPRKQLPQVHSGRCENILSAPNVSVSEGRKHRNRKAPSIMCEPKGVADDCLLTYANLFSSWANECPQSAGLGNSCPQFAVEVIDSCGLVPSCANWSESVENTVQGGQPEWCASAPNLPSCTQSNDYATESRALCAAATSTCVDSGPHILGTQATGPPAHNMLLITLQIPDTEHPGVRPLQSRTRPALLDEGCNHSGIDLREAQKLVALGARLNTDFKPCLTAFNQQKMSSLGTMNVHVTIGGLTRLVNFVVLEKVPYGCAIGLECKRAFGMVTDDRLRAVSVYGSDTPIPMLTSEQLERSLLSTSPWCCFGASADRPVKQVAKAKYDVDKLHTGEQFLLVRTDRSVVLPPLAHSMVPCYVQFDDILHSYFAFRTFLFEPISEHHRGLRYCCSLHNAKTFTPDGRMLLQIRVTNPLDVPMELDMEEIVGSISHIDIEECLQIGNEPNCQAGEPQSTGFSMFAAPDLKAKYAKYTAGVDILSEQAVSEEIGRIFAENPRLKGVNLSQSPLTEREKLAFVRMLADRVEAYAKDEGDIGFCNMYEHRIDTGSNPPFQLPPRRQPYHLRKVRDEILTEFLRLGIIEYSSSPYASPCLVVPKPGYTDRWRLVVDFQWLNDQTKFEPFPIPPCAELAREFHGMKYYTSIDCLKGFHQCAIALRDQEKTAFVTEDGHYQYTRMPMGLKNAPSSFQKMMNDVLVGQPKKHVKCYMDDIGVADPTFMDHLIHVGEVLQCLIDANLRIIPMKCVWAQSQMKFLGYIVSEHGVVPNPAQIEAISKWPVPTTIRQVRGFLGATGHQRTFIENYAVIAAPLYELTTGFKTDKVFLNEQQLAAFQKLKECMLSLPMLMHPDLEKEFFLTTDASNVGVGGVLRQKDAAGKLRVIGYFSKKLNPAQQNYSVTEKEMLAIVQSLKFFRLYLLGKKFTVITDHQPLSYLLRRNIMTKLEGKSRVVRWCEYMTAFEFEVKYEAGKTNVADPYSRNPVFPADAVHCEIGDTVFAVFTDDADLEAFIKAQQEDSYSKAIYKLLETGERPRIKKMRRRIQMRAQHFLLENRLLYRVQRPTQNSSASVDPLAVQRSLYLPRQYRDQALVELHEEGGHQSALPTYEKLRLKYYWPDCQKETFRHCDSCFQCAKTKPGCKKAPPIKHLPVHMGVWDIVSMDFVKAGKPSSRKNISILTVTDNFSKWVEAAPVKEETAAAAIKALDLIFMRVGQPKIIHTDNQPFRAKCLQEFCKHWGVTLTYSMPYNPEGNSIAESANRTILQLLRNYVNYRTTDWDDYLNVVLHAYRTSVHSATGDTPFHIFYCRDSFTPLERKILPLAHEYASTADWPRQRVETAIKIWDQAHAFLNERLRLSESRQRKHAFDRSLAVGDLVMFNRSMVKNNPAGDLPSYKLRPGYRGPYRVIELFEDSNHAKIRELSLCAPAISASISHLKRYIARP